MERKKEKFNHSKLLKITIVILIVFCSFSLVGCTNKNEDTVTSLSELKDKEWDIGIPTDFGCEDALQELSPKSNIVPITDALAIKSVADGKLDAIALTETYLREAVEKEYKDKLVVLDEPVYTFYIALCLSRDCPIENYEQKVNECITEMKESGKMDEIINRWENEENPEMPDDLPKAENPEYTIRVATFGQQPPQTYLDNNELVGTDIELVYYIAAYLNCDIEFEIANFDSMLAGINTGKYDMIASNMFVTEERSESVLFSTPYREINISLAVRSNNEKESANLWSVFKDGFNKTFINQNRWQQIVKGLGTSLLITIVGFLLANVIGALFCAMSLSNNHILNSLSRIYNAIIQGTPLLVILLILYYVIFGKTKISGTVIAIVGFGITTGAGLANLFEGGINSVSKGQKEASLALGFNNVQTFFGVVLPQGFRTILTGYFSSLIGLMKSTSIVGYVSVIDLTKASDMIRSATYEPFFPLITTAIIYFVIANIFLMIMRKIQKRLAPKRVVAKEADK